MEPEIGLTTSPRPVNLTDLEYTQMIHYFVIGMPRIFFLTSCVPSNARFKLSVASSSRNPCPASICHHCQLFRINRTTTPLPTGSAWNTSEVLSQQLKKRPQCNRFDFNYRTGCCIAIYFYFYSYLNHKIIMEKKHNMEPVLKKKNRLILTKIDLTYERTCFQPQPQQE